MTREYQYVGPHALLDLLSQPSRRLQVESADDIKSWLLATQLKKWEGSVTCTFIIDLEHRLWINDQRSEHVVCAAGQNVLSAGEITFTIARQRLEASEITNLSTGYCPEPDSWRVIKAVLDRLHLPHPDSLTTAFLFRRCGSCQTINVVKDDWFFCAVCDAALSPEWNIDL